MQVCTSDQSELRENYQLVFML